MKKTWNIFSMLLVCTLLLTLTACGGGETGDSEAPEQGSSSTAASLQREEGNSKGKDDNVLVMGTNAEFPPYEFYENNQIVGIDAEIAGRIAEKLGMTLEIEDMDFESIVAAVESGTIDMGLAGMTVTEDRQKSVNFTASYATGVQVIIVPEGSDITGVDDLFEEGANTVIGVQTNTTGDLYSSSDIEDKGLGEVMRYNKGADAVNALNTGKVDCVIIDNEPAKAFVKANEGLVILDTAYAVEDYAIAVAKNNTELLEKVDTAIQELIDDGTVAEIIDKYIGQE